jgi:hypothetical protein
MHLWESGASPRQVLGVSIYLMIALRVASATVGRVKERSDVPDGVLNEAVCWVRYALPNLLKVLPALIVPGAARLQQ